MKRNYYYKFDAVAEMLENNVEIEKIIIKKTNLEDNNKKMSIAFEKLFKNVEVNKFIRIFKFSILYLKTL